MTDEQMALCPKCGRWSILAAIGGDCLVCTMGWDHEPRCGHHYTPLEPTPDGPRCRHCFPESFLPVDSDTCAGCGRCWSSGDSQEDGYVYINDTDWLCPACVVDRLCKNLSELKAHLLKWMRP